MRTISSTISSSDVKAASRGWRLVVAGYSTAAVALVAFLTINGVSGIPSAATIGTAVLVVIGFLLPVAGMLQLRRDLVPSENTARYGFAMQAFGLVVLMFGVVLTVIVSSLSGYLVSSVFVAIAGASAIIGAVLLRKHFKAIASNPRGAILLIFGTVLIFSGVGVIVGSNIAFEYLISQIQNTVYVDMGATISACGCVLAAYSFFIIATNYLRTKSQRITDTIAPKKVTMRCSLSTGKSPSILHQISKRHRFRLLNQQHWFSLSQNAR